MDDLTLEQRHRNMAHIHSSNTQIEILLRKALWKRGFRYRKNYTLLPGKPDIAITKTKTAIFCDGEFFHGKDWQTLQIKLRNSNNSEYWIEKIAGNIERDKQVNERLRSLGWTVIRIWGKDIKKDIDGCVNRILESSQKKLDFIHTVSYNEENL